MVMYKGKLKITRGIEFFKISKRRGARSKFKNRQNGPILRSAGKKYQRLVMLEMRNRLKYNVEKYKIKETFQELTTD